MSSIYFHSEGIGFNLKPKKIYKTWVRQIISQEEKELSSINYIFCSDKFLHKINLEHLNHDNYTDIITFPYSDSGPIEGDIYISIERVEENANSYKLPFSEELHRVMAHGVLHLCGFGDKSSKEKSMMRKKEDWCINLLSTIEA